MGWVWVDTTKLIKMIKQPFGHRNFGAPEATAFNKKVNSHAILSTDIFPCAHTAPR